MPYKFVKDDRVEISTASGQRGAVVNLNSGNITQKWGDATPDKCLSFGLADVEVTAAGDPDPGPHRLRADYFETHSTGCTWYFFGGVWYRI